MSKSFYFKSLALLSSVMVLFSCSKKESQALSVVALESKTFQNLHAPVLGGQGQPESGDFVKFSFSQGAMVNDDSWDVAFRGTTIIVNGGEKIGITDEPERTGDAGVSIASNTFEEITRAPEAGMFTKDMAGKYAVPTGAGNGWYNYDGDTHLITPIAGRILVVKTHDGKYAKMEILSYYKDAPENPNARTSPTRYYTFKYVYQPNGTTF